MEHNEGLGPCCQILVSLFVKWLSLCRRTYSVFTQVHVHNEEHETLRATLWSAVQVVHPPCNKQQQWSFLKQAKETAPLMYDARFCVHVELKMLLLQQLRKHALDPVPRQQCNLTLSSMELVLLLCSRSKSHMLWSFELFFLCKIGKGNTRHLFSSARITNCLDLRVRSSVPGSDPAGKQTNKELNDIQHWTSSRALRVKH